MEGSKQIKDDVSHFTSLFEKKKLADTNDKKKLTRMPEQFPNQTRMGVRSQHVVPKGLI